MEKKEFKEQVLRFQEEVKNSKFEWENVFRLQTLNEERTEIVIMIGNKLASKELFKNDEEAKKYIEKKPWELIAALICSITNNVIELKIQNLKNKKKCT